MQIIVSLETRNTTEVPTWKGSFITKQARICSSKVQLDEVGRFTITAVADAVVAADPLALPQSVRIVGIEP